MPANLPPEYFKAEARYQQARTIDEKILATEELIRLAPKHKGTEKLLKMLKRRLAKLRQELQAKQARRVRRGVPSFAVKKESAVQVALVGAPNSGKSTVLHQLTAARPKIGIYPFTTQHPVPGMMQFEDVQIQLVEVPAVIEGSSLGKGLGARPLSIARNADVIVLVVDASTKLVEQVLILINELEAAGIKLNQRPPKLSVQRRITGGIEVRGAGMFKGGEAELKRVLQEQAQRDNEAEEKYEWVQAVDFGRPGQGEVLSLVSFFGGRQVEIAFIAALICFMLFLGKDVERREGWNFYPSRALV